MNSLNIIVLFTILASACASQDIDVQLWGAKKAKYGQFPWVVNIYADDKICNGALISDQWVVTAANCVTKKSMFRVRLGSIALSLEDPARVQVLTREGYTHPNYDGRYWHDIGLIKLGSPVKFTDYIGPIKLYQGERLQANQTITLYSWAKSGKPDDADPALFLRYGDTYALDNDECEDLIGSVNGESICGDKGVVPCWTGEAAAPGTVMDKTGERFLATIYSSYIDPVFCDNPQKSPFRMTRVKPYISWIKEVTGLDL